MKRTDASGFAPGNLYTEGDPGMGVPATVVGSDEMNNLQEELAQFIESRGITLDSGNFNQLQAAIENLTGEGVTTNFSIPNNQSSPASITGLVFDKTAIKSSVIAFDLNRQTTTENFQEVGQIYALYNPVSDDWEISLDSKFDDAGVIFSITSAGQLQYTSTNMAGASYAGTLRHSVVRSLTI